MDRAVPRTCPLCEAMCGLTVHVAPSGEVLKVRGDREDPFSQGFMCPKGARLHDLHADPDRLHQPLVRRQGALVPCTWDEAFAEVARLLTPRMEAHGRASVALYLGNPNVHNLDGTIWGRPLIKALKTPNLFTASTMDQMPRHVSSARMFGHPDTIAVPDLDRTDLLVVLGANPLASNGSLCSAPDFPGRLRALRDRGGRLVVVDPARTRTADVADQHLPIRPGTDVLLLAAMVRHVLVDRTPRLGHLTDHIDGLAALRDAVEPFAAEAVAERCGLEANAIRALADAVLSAERAVVYGRIGTHTTAFGTAASWLVDALVAVTGHLDAPGGVMFPLPAHFAPRPRRAWRSGRRHSRVRGLPEVRSELPIATLPDEVLTPGEGQVRALITVAGNPALSAPDSARMDEALRSLEVLICVDPYLNETARHAHVVLPPPSPLARWHYDLAFTNLAVRNVAKLSEPVVPRPEGSLEEWEILARLTAIASGAPASTPPAAVGQVVLQTLAGQVCADPSSRLHCEDPAALLASLPDAPQPVQALDLLLRAGPYGEGTEHALSVATLRAHPHGLDLGPLQPRLPDGLSTPSGRVQLAPDELVSDLTRAEALLEEATPDLVLVGRRHVRSNNSWMHNLPKLVGGQDRCTLRVHPVDARRLGLVHEGRARVASRVGELVAPVEVHDGLRPGVVSLPHGWGHGQPGTRMRVAAAHAGVNSNLLTDPEPLDPLSGNAVLNGIPVQITAV